MDFVGLKEGLLLFQMLENLDLVLDRLMDEIWESVRQYTAAQI